MFNVLTQMTPRPPSPEPDSPAPDEIPAGSPTEVPPRTPREAPVSEQLSEQLKIYY